jgi:trimeric autotransporter adhesin
LLAHSPEGPPFYHKHYRSGIWKTFFPAGAAFVPLEESKVVSFHPQMNFKLIMRRAVCALLLFFAVVAVPAAYGQFTLTAGVPLPPAVDPGSSATVTITLTPGTGFSGTVDLTCAVSSSQVTTNLPTCAISPDSETAASTPSLTILTSANTPAGAYQVTVTGTDGATVVTTTVNLNVANLAQDYTITVYPTTAIPSPVVAGSVATAAVTIAPIGSYTGNVTLSCLSVSPVVAGAPTCSFDKPTVPVSSGVPGTSTLTLTTYGYINTPTTTGMLFGHHALYGLWMSFPALIVAGLTTTGKRGRKFLGIFFLLAIVIAFLFMPACGSNNAIITTNINEVTPKNTYTFTLTGADANGIGPSSTTSAIVTLEVTSE